jgi:hypothetical protein
VEGREMEDTSTWRRVCMGWKECMGLWWWSSIHAMMERGWTDKLLGSIGWCGICVVVTNQLEDANGAIDQSHQVIPTVWATASGSWHNSHPHEHHIGITNCSRRRPLPASGRLPLQVSLTLFSLWFGALPPSTLTHVGSGGGVLLVQ